VPPFPAASSDGGLWRSHPWQPETERHGRAQADAGLVATPPRTPCSKDTPPASLHRGALNRGGYIGRLFLRAAAQGATPELPHVGKIVQERIHSLFV
jgi:hypothetical protein